MNKKVRINISLDKEVADNLKLISERRHTTVSQWITDQVVAEKNRMDFSDSYNAWRQLYYTFNNKQCDDVK